MRTYPSARTLAALALLLLGAAAPARAQAPVHEAHAAAAPTTVIVVRHAEKESDDHDTPLSAAGHQRAADLADALADAGITAVYATQLQRTQSTVRPLAERLRLPVTIRSNVGGTEAFAEALAREILARHRGETVLVAAHSNSTPLVVRALGGAEVDPITEPEFHHVFVVTIPPVGAPTTLRLRYGRWAGGEK
jgi:broad specificity phosphatase PhoE